MSSESESESEANHLGQISERKENAEEVENGDAVTNGNGVVEKEVTWVDLVS